MKEIISSVCGVPATTSPTHAANSMAQATNFTRHSSIEFTLFSFPSAQQPRDYRAACHIPPVELERGKTEVPRIQIPQQRRTLKIRASDVEDEIDQRVKLALCESHRNRALHDATSPLDIFQ